MSDDIRAALRETARIAFRFYDQLTRREREHVLVALVELEPQPASEVAQDTLHHLRAGEKSQMTLRGLLDGPAGDGDGSALP